MFQQQCDTLENWPGSGTTVSDTLTRAHCSSSTPLYHVNTLRPDMKTYRSTHHLPTVDTAVVADVAADVAAHRGAAVWEEDWVLERATVNVAVPILRWQAFPSTTEPRNNAITTSDRGCSAYDDHTFIFHKSAQTYPSDFSLSRLLWSHQWWRI